MIVASRKTLLNQERLAAARHRLESAAELNDLKLNAPLTPTRKLIADLNVLAAKIRGAGASRSLETDAVNMAQQEFPRLFPATLEKMMEEAMDDPEGYWQRIHDYEKVTFPPAVPFETENDHYRLIVRDPLRIREEHFLFRALLNNGFLGQGVFRALDLGTGSGRLALCLADALEEFCPEDTFEIYGLDLNPINVRDALETRRMNGYGNNIKFVLGDMTRTPFPQGRFDLCNASSSTYLVPLYQRPFHLLEMARVLRVGGEGVLTGPNEKFTARAYARCMAATNLKTYLNPANMLLAQKLGPVGLLIDRMSKLRIDFSFPDNRSLGAALRNAGCTIDLAETWPAGGTTDLYSGLRFRTSPETERRLAKYNAFMDKLNRANNIATI